MRVASIAHWGRTPLADGSGEDATGSRLTAAGVEAVAELERLGVLFDVSHLGASGVAHVLEIATRPVIATHSSARALRDHHRNLTDDQILGDNVLRLFRKELSGAPRSGPRRARSAAADPPAFRLVIVWDWRSGGGRWDV